MIWDRKLLFWHEKAVFYWVSEASYRKRVISTIKTMNGSQPYSKARTASGLMSCKCSQSQREPSFLRFCPYHSTFSSGKMCNENKMHKWVWKGWSCPFFFCRVCSLVSWTSVPLIVITSQYKHHHILAIPHTPKSICSPRAKLLTEIPSPFQENWHLQAPFPGIQLRLL